MMITSILTAKKTTRDQMRMSIRKAKKMVMMLVVMNKNKTLEFVTLKTILIATTLMY